MAWTNARTLSLAGLAAACSSGPSSEDPPAPADSSNVTSTSSAADDAAVTTTANATGSAGVSVNVTGSSGDASTTSAGGGQGEQGGTQSGTGATSNTSVGGAGTSTVTAATTGAGGAGGDGVPSPGCGAGSAESGRITIDVAGSSREFILELPQDYAAARPYPLVFAWHGLMYSADWVAAGDEPASGPYYGLAAAADGNAIFVAPQALSGGWSNQDGRDIAFVDAMLDYLKTRACIDESRVFSVGFSFGAIMTLSIACERAAQFRAVAPMSGRLPEACPDADQPLAYWGAHGDADQTITLSEGESVRAHFVERNQCTSESTPTEPSGCQSYQGCAAGTPVTFCVFSGEHVPAPFSGEGAWNFFAQF